jgi:hypothetical protein
MTRLAILVFVTLILCTSVLAQGGFVINKLEKINDDERAVLRKGFKLSDSATITEVKGKPFPPDAPLKVCVETILDPNVRHDVTNWIAEWNQKDAAKYGKLDIEPDSLQAHVSLLRYLHPLPPTDPISAMTWTDPKGKIHRLIPVYSYLMVRKPDALEILWRKVDLTYQEEHEFSAKLLIDQLKKLMKEPAKH